MNVEMNPVSSFPSLLDQQQIPGHTAQVQLQQAPSQFVHPVTSMAMANAASVATQSATIDPKTSLANVDAPVKQEDDLLKKDIQVPSMLKHMIWEATIDESQPGNTSEASFLQLIDGNLCLSSVPNIPKFLNLLKNAKTEPERALVLVILRNTATSENTKLAKTCTAAYEKCGGLKIAKRWLEEAVEWSYTDLLVLLLEVLKKLPLQLASITEARINEPIVNLRKNAREEKVKRTAQDLLKYWRTKFTEKANKASAAAATTPATASDAAAPKAAVPSAANPVKVAESKPSATPATPASSAATKPGEGSPSQVKPLKKRAIKRLERLPYGGGTSVSKSSDLIGNLMQRKNAKDAAAASIKPKNDSLMQKLSSKEVTSESKSASSKSGSSPPPAETKRVEEFTMELPTIQSFNAAVNTVSKKIRWADENGKDLVKIKFIESWRDLIMHDPNQNEESFRDAKLREHADERHAMKSHKESEKFVVAIAHEWSAPALVRLPEALEKRRQPVSTDEVAIQRARTRREMEYLVLDGEIPPVSPKEWVRAPTELQRGPPVEIPLSDVGPPAVPEPASSAPSYANDSQQYYAGESEEDAALREALGPLKKSTIALLLENEDILPQVYDEAQRNGNQIPDGRVIEILEQRRHQQHQQRFGPPSGNMGYNNYGGGNGPNYHQPPPAYIDYNRPAPQSGQYQQQSHKRKAPGGGGILSDAPPPSKRLTKRGTAALPCMYFSTPSGCKHGNSCQFAHEYGPPPSAGPGGNNEYIYNATHGHVGGRFGHNHHPMGMRGGGGGGNMRHMRGGR
ncbi:hypothetical protein FI667_g1526, partial [Globisporangium splendens]